MRLGPFNTETPRLRGFFSAPDRIRTCDPRLKPMLHPTELGRVGRPPCNRAPQTRSVRVSTLCQRQHVSRARSDESALQRAPPSAGSVLPLGSAHCEHAHRVPLAVEETPHQRLATQHLTL